MDQRTHALKIAALGSEWFPSATGGLERYFAGLTAALIERGDLVDSYCVGPPPPPMHANRFPIGMPADSFLARLRNAHDVYRKHLKTGRYDVVNMHFAPYALPALSSIPKDAARVFTFHGPWASESAIEGAGSVSVLAKTLLERFVYHRASRYITLSNAFRRILHERYGIADERISVVPMGIDTERYVPHDDRAAIRTRLGWPQDRLIVFTARRLVQRVGISELVRAAALLDAQTRGSLAIMVAGRGPSEPLVRSEIAELRVDDTVTLMGFVSDEDLQLAYAAADITIVPTQYLEGFGTIVAESLATGTPVVVTPVDGLPEAVDGLGDLVLEDKTPEAIADFLRRAVARTAQLPSRARCRDYAVERFAWPAVAEAVRSVFLAAT